MADLGRKAVIQRPPMITGAYRYFILEVWINCHLQACKTTSKLGVNFK